MRLPTTTVFGRAFGFLGNLCIYSVVRWHILLTLCGQPRESFSNCNGLPHGWGKGYIELNSCSVPRAAPVHEHTMKLSL